MAHKAVGLISGGLDSILAAKLILDQGICVLGVNFISPFCACAKRGCLYQATKVARELGFPLRVIPLREEYIQIVKNPKYGYGRNLNPCIDCRILLFSKARKIMEEENASFLFTGEVLGERPMSQNLRAMRIIERESGCEGLLLRPLSAKLLPPTNPEICGIVDRERLLAIKGRSRKPQMALAEKFGIKEYPTPAGGCLLTNKEFAAKVRDAFRFGEDSPEDMELLKIGRHFRLRSGAKLIVGRDERENGILFSLMERVRDGICIMVKDFPGPVALLRSKGKNFDSPPGASVPSDIETAAAICARYSDAKDKEEVEVLCGSNVTVVRPIREEEIVSLRVA